ncbi:hypothetical protein OGATHE_006476 [Ogataea polymorpha]|uniref:Uncharacterized protein n=1 Tax=Ogataea polymorpha TaxID=460523 RepID=A0A9P8NT52_9ASCO|nr:hypothetical protein OGATHE_006476 [Ogataea polymorpha]
MAQKIIVKVKIEIAMDRFPALTLAVRPEFSQTTSSGVMEVNLLEYLSSFEYGTPWYALCNSKWLANSMNTDPVFLKPSGYFNCSSLIFLLYSPTSSIPVVNRAFFFPKNGILESL